MKEIIIIIMGIVFFIIALMVGIPQYNVWQQGLSGEAELARAEQNRQITVEEAQADKEASVFYAEAEVIRAKGVFEANEIISGGLGGPEGYLKYLFINNLEKIDNQGGTVIYIPTEAGMPILEAGRFNQRD